MESMIGLRSCTFPNQSIRMPSGFHAARATTKSHLSLTHSSLSLTKDVRSLRVGYNSSLSLSKGSRSCPFEPILGPITCTREVPRSPPPDKRDGNDAAKGRLSRFFGKMGAKLNLTKEQSQPPPAPSKGGNESRPDFHAQAEGLMGQMDSEGISKIDVQLNEAYKNDPHNAYHLQMELINSLINRGKFEVANRYCKDVRKKENWSQLLGLEPRLPLYEGILSAIVHNDYEEAKKKFRECVEILPMEE